jgi:Uncharacterized protein conserved in bacteria (DUF2252)
MRVVLRVLCFAVLFVSLARLTRAQAPTPPAEPPPRLEASAQLTFLGTTGNASSQSLGASGDVTRSGDAAKIAGYCGDDDTLNRALAQFTEAYGDQTERDHGALVKAIKNGRLQATQSEE